MKTSAYINICVAGATGKIGSRLIYAISKSPDLRLVGAVSRTHPNKKLGDIINNCPKNIRDVELSGSVEQALKTQTDVLIDYTQPNSAMVNVREAILNKVHVVIGTSGLTNDDYANIDILAQEKKVGVIAANNFALTFALLQFCATQIIKHINFCEIIDYASPDVLMAPLGTTKELAHHLSEFTSQRSEINNEPLSRGEVIEGTRVHSVRLPGHISCVEVIFGKEDEQLILRHKSNSSNSYVSGTLLAVRKVSSYVGLVRGLDKILEI